jgi:hypothetical protein
MKVARLWRCDLAEGWLKLATGKLRLLYRYFSLQLFEPVEDQVDLGRSGGLRLGWLQHQEVLAVGGYIVIRRSSGTGDI